MKIKSLIVLLLVVFSSIADENKFRFQSEISPVEISGFSKILLDPRILSKVKNDLADIRLYDSSNTEIPYLLTAETKVYSDKKFEEYYVVSRQFRIDSITEIIFKTNDEEKLSGISILIRNAHVSKNLKVTGSFDRKTWFVVKESQEISSIENSGDVSILKLVDLPTTNYLFYKIEINDKNSEPIDIIKIGSVISFEREGKYSLLNSSFKVTDSVSKKTSWVRVLLEDTMLIDKLVLKIEKPEYFVRNAEILIRNFDSTYSSVPIVISSKESLAFGINGIRANEFLIKIENKDNQPLKFSEIQCHGLNHYLIAKLEKDNTYKLLFGNKGLGTPDYDLRYFHSVLPADINTLSTNDIEEIKSVPKIEVEKKPDFFSDKRFIWGALIVVILLLGIVTFRMMRNIKN